MKTKEYYLIWTACRPEGWGIYEGYDELDACKVFLRDIPGGAMPEFVEFHNARLVRDGEHFFDENGNQR